MSTFSRLLLSGSPGSGRPIPVDAADTTVHTAVAGTTAFDEVYLWAANVTGSAATLTVKWGGTADPGDDLVKAYSIPANSGPVQIAFGQVLNGGVAAKATSGTANAINLTGYVNRIQ